MRPTIKDVGRLAGVSIATVSNVMNGHPNVTAKTRKRVQDAIDKLGYRASRAARSLPAGATGLLGYWMPPETNPNPAMDIFLHRIIEHAALIGLEVMVVSPGPEHSELEAIANVLRRGGVDAFVLSGVGYDDPRVDYLARQNVPFAAFGQFPEKAHAAWVDVDGAAGTRAAVEHLLGLGRRKIAFVGWPEGSRTGDERFEGWTSGLLAADLPVVDNDIFRAPNRLASGVRIAAQIVAGSFDAVVCVTDTLAFGVMKGLRKQGVEVGTDIAVSGFDNVPAAALVPPGLTSVRQPMGEVGKALLSQISALLDGQKGTPGLLFEPELVVRRSTDPRVTDDG